MYKPKTRKNMHWRSTKIVSTLGPSSRSVSIIKELIKHGVNIFRLNMSHGSHEDHLKVVENIKMACKDMGVHVGILVDLCGPKIRVGKLKHGQTLLKEGSIFTVTCKNVIGNDKIVSSQYRSLYKDLKKNDRIFIDDGKIELVVKSIEGKDIACKIKSGGLLHDNKGMNLPDSCASTGSYTSKDKRDTDFAIKIQADFIALSFVKDKKDVNKAKNYLRSKGCDIPIISKIERREAVYNADEIISNSYGIMIARGDLGIELPAQEVPIIQKELITKCRRENKPVIVATQMLESMIYSPQPTRAEVGDVANAALSGVDAVMLSAETANGNYPVKAVKMMDDILREMEAYQLKKSCFGEKNNDIKDAAITTEREAFSFAVTTLAKNLDLRAIIIPTRSGTTAVALSSERPLAPLIAVSTDIKICRRLLLHWGVLSFNLDDKLTHNWKELSRNISRRCLMTKKGNNVLLVSGFNDDPELNEPVLKLITL